MCMYFINVFSPSVVFFFIFLSVYKKTQISMFNEVQFINFNGSCFLHATQKSLCDLSKKRFLMKFYFSC
jgi:hypothetical protein